MSNPFNGQSKVGSIGELQMIPMCAEGYMCWRAKAPRGMEQGAFIYPPCKKMENRIEHMEDRGLSIDAVEDIDWILGGCPNDCDMLTGKGYEMLNYRIVTDRKIGIEVKTNRQTHGDNGNPRTTQFTQNIPLELIQNTSLYNRNQTKTGTDARTGKQYTYRDGVGYWNKFGVNEDDKNDWFLFYQPLTVRINKEDGNKHFEYRCKYADHNTIQQWFDDDSIGDEDILVIRYPVDYAIVVSGRTLWKIEQIGNKDGKKFRPFRSVTTWNDGGIQIQLELVPVKCFVSCYNMLRASNGTVCDNLIEAPEITRQAGYEPARVVPIPMFFKHKDKDVWNESKASGITLDRIARHRYIAPLKQRVYIPKEILSKSRGAYTAFDSGTSPKWGDRYREWYVPVDVYKFDVNWNVKSY